jgi:murein DD-endopeptidase MepM/ murein hydrolase activator NlpD
LVAAVVVVALKGSGLAWASDYTVRAGDTLGGVATRLGIRTGELAAANAITDFDLIQAGQVLVVPSAGRYSVRSGDTLSGVAERLGVRTRELVKVNAITDPDFLAVGQVLTVPDGWWCPVDGPVSFVNDYGYVRPDGARHEGVDLNAPRGTPVVAPVAGRVVRYPNKSGGNAFQLYGRDGVRYYGAHLDSYGEQGDVTAGTVIGYVGDTGDARGGPTHLHFEMHPSGGRESATPYPRLVAACR